MPTENLTILTTGVTPRLKYTFDLIFKELLGISYTFVHNQQQFLNCKGPRLTYGDQQISDEIFIYASKLLFEKGIEDQQISVFDWNGVKAFFATHPKYVFPFDPFAASFYLVSRYEEYLPHLRDSHDRYETTESLSFKRIFRKTFGKHLCYNDP
ncbi:MAG: hypothetical protein IPP71_23615 [Bacteroidetes bacterium]|nr:hypothetical protein [Bacteroidota bacterium]